MKSKIKNLTLTILGAIFYIIGIASFIFSMAYQFILSYKKFGVIITKNIFIPHWSAWFYLVSLISVGVGYLLLLVGEKK